MTNQTYCVVGNIIIDDLVYADGSTRWAMPGGNAVYGGLGLSVWSERPIIVAPMGLDYPIKEVEARLNMSHCRKMDKSLRNWGLYETDGSRHFIFRTMMGAWESFSPMVSDLEEVSYDAVHIAPVPCGIQVQFAEALRAAGTKFISLDVENRELGDINRADLKRLVRAVDLFLPSRQEVDTLFPGSTVIDALRRLRDLAGDAAVVAIKCGADGVAFHPSGDADFYTVPTAATTVVDATGAGDAFCGGALFGFSMARDAREAVLRGTVSASFAIEAPGPQALMGANPEVAARRLDELRARVDARAF